MALGRWFPTFADTPSHQGSHGVTCSPDLCSAWISFIVGNAAAIWTVTAGQWHGTQIVHPTQGVTGPLVRTDEQSQMSCGPDGGCVAVDSRTHVAVYLE